MLDIKPFRSNPEKIKEAIKNRNMTLDVDEIVRLDKKRRDVIVEVEDLRSLRNKTSDEIAVQKKAGRDAAEQINQMRAIGDKIKSLDEELVATEEKLNDLLAQVPNIPHETTPIGEDACFNVEIRKWKEPTKFAFEPKSHYDIGETLDILDLKRGAKIAESRFVLMKGQGALLERALINFMLDMHTKEHGYTEVFPPIMVSEKSMFGTGQLPKLREEMYQCTDGLFLVPTAEVPLTNIHGGEILDKEKLPIKYVAFTPCFRREAGAAGKETRGLIRLHQFNKVELVKIADQESSYDELEKLLNNAEKILQELALPYRVIALASGDLSFAAAKCYDIEVWLPSYDDYKEISSCSNFEDFQARRIGIKYREEDGSLKLAHTLNGSGLAIGRTLAAILENYQNEDGSVSVPSALIKYMGTNRIS
jgi:seryl-tRNA synthetase